MKQFLAALRMFVFMTCLTGLAYPIAVTVVGRVAFPDKASGSMIEHDGHPVGSALVAQEFKSPKYFWPRPSAAGYNPLPSNASNFGPTSGDLKKIFDERKKKLMKANPGMGEPPQDLLFASGSGLDPDISPQAALYQARRVAKARGMDSNQVMALVEKYTQKRQWGIFGEPRVNVLDLNLALDSISR